MINFVLLTTTPAEVRNFLINRGILQQVTDPITGKTSLVGVFPGVEYTANAVPNPIITDPGSGGSPADPGYVSPTYDTRKVYLVKLVIDAEADEIAGFQQTNPDGTLKPVDLRTKLGNWVHNNGVRDDLNVNGTIVPAMKIGTTVWLARDDTTLFFGTWQ